GGGRGRPGARLAGGAQDPRRGAAPPRRPRRGAPGPPHPGGAHRRDGRDDPRPRGRRPSRPRRGGPGHGAARRRLRRARYRGRPRRPGRVRRAGRRRRRATRRRLLPDPPAHRRRRRADGPRGQGLAPALRPPRPAGHGRQGPRERHRTGLRARRRPPRGAADPPQPRARRASRRGPAQRRRRGRPARAGRQRTTRPARGGRKWCQDGAVDRRNVTNDLQSRLRADLDRAGYYPRLVQGVLDIALAGEEVRAYLVHPETTFDSREVRRHLTALALTPTRLVMAHVDDVPGDAVPSAAATTEAVPLHRTASVALTHGASDPASTHGGMRNDELTIAVTWGGAQQVDLAPAGCSDPDCD